MTQTQTPEWPCKCACIVKIAEEFICDECGTVWMESELAFLDGEGSSAESMRDYAMCEELEWVLLLS